MGKKLINGLLIFILGGIQVLIGVGCHSQSGPATPYDLPFTPTPTQIVHITGAVNVAVQDKSQAVTGLLAIYAIPPSGAATYSASTTTTGIATFQPALPGSGELDFCCTGPNPLSLRPQHDHHACLSRQRTGQLQLSRPHHPNDPAGPQRIQQFKWRGFRVWAFLFPNREPIGARKTSSILTSA